MTDATKTPAEPTLLKTWKISTSPRGAVLTINGQSFELGESLAAVAFDLQRAADGWNIQATGTDAHTR